MRVPAEVMNVEVGSQAAFWTEGAGGQSTVMEVEFWTEGAGGQSTVMERRTTVAFWTEGAGGQSTVMGRRTTGGTRDMD